MYRVSVLLSGDPVKVRSLHGTDVFLTSSDDDRHAIDHDLLRRRRDGHEPGSALSVHSLRGSCHWQARDVARVSRDIHAGSSRGEHGANYDVFYLVCLDLRLSNSITNGMPHERRRFDVVQGAAKRASDWGTGRGNNHCVSHDGVAPVG